MKIAIVQYVDPHDLNSYPMLGLGYIKSYVEHHRPGSFEFVFIQDMKGLEAHDPFDADLYAFTALSQDYSDVIRMARYVRTRTDAPVILGGSHISFLSPSLDRVFQCGALGDGETVFLEICDALLKDRHLLPGTLAAIPGLVYWADSGEQKFSAKSAGVAQLDELPFPDRRFGPEGLLPHLLSSRGCPFTCSFCTSSEYWKKFRAFSADYIKAEIVEVLSDFPDCDFLPFWDDLFVANRKRFRAVVNVLEASRLTQVVAFSCGVRIDLVDRDLCELLVRGNYKAVFFGLESASDDILRWLKGGKATVKRMQEALDLLHEYKITVAAPFIVGIPGETEDQLRETYDFVIRNMEDGKLSEAQSHVMCPMPGTQIWRYALSCNFVEESADFAWDRMRYYSGWRNYITDTRKRGDFETWVAARKSNNSLYINEVYGQDRLFEFMAPYEEKIDRMGLEFAKY